MKYKYMGLIFIMILIAFACINNNKSITNPGDPQMNLNYLKKIDTSLHDTAILYYCEIAQWKEDYQGNKRILVGPDLQLSYAKNIPGDDYSIFNGEYIKVKTLQIQDLDIIYDFCTKNKFNNFPDKVPTPSDLLIDGGSDSYLYFKYKDINRCIQFGPEVLFIKDFLKLIDHIIVQPAS